MPFEIQGKPFHCQAEILKSDGKNNYKLFIAKYLLDYPERLVYNLIHELVQIRLLENNVEFDTGEDTDLFIYLAGIYFGFGLILSRNLIDTGKQVYGFWETKWNYTSEMPVPVMAYSLALFHSLFEDEGAEWRDLLPPAFKIEFFKAQEAFKKNPHKLYNKRELDAADLYNISAQKSDELDFEEAIACLQKILFLTQDANLKAIVYNNIGYNYLLINEYEKSIPHFQKALEINPGFGYANDNLGFALIMTGELESGKYYVGLAIKCGNNDNGYSYRNLALYYQQKKEMKLAEEYFQKAFDSTAIPIDLLEYFYAKFLFETGDSETSMKYLKIAVDKKNPQAVDLMKEITSNGLKN
jgi:tetratricopeptide (TPR) repeat protein